MSKKLVLVNLDHRHPGVTVAVAATYYEAASVCYDRHHASPADITIQRGGKITNCFVEWTVPDIRVRAAHGNEIDATEAAAYGVSLAAVEMTDGLVAIRRAETGTGADYYIAPPGTSLDDLESCIRLEVSGTNEGNEAVMQRRLIDKIAQLTKGDGNLPAIACVVGFKEKAIAMAKLEQK